MERKFTVQKSQKLSEFLTSINISARLQRKLKISPNKITRNGILIRSIDIVNAGDEIIIYTEDKNKIEPNADLKAGILFEDDDAIIFNKPAGMPTIPSHKHRFDSLGNLFAYLYPNTTYRPINRLDRNTSGCVLVAKNQRAAYVLQNNSEKTYYAIVEGKTQEYGNINLPIARESEGIIKRCVSPNGKMAITEYKTLKSNDKASFVEIHLKTGRTHQIRVHFSAIGHPLFGDDLYGGNTEFLKRQALHCGELKIENKIKCNCPLPKDMSELLYFLI